MSEVPETEFDLEKLFLPAWAQEAPGANKYANFAGEEPRERRQGRGPGPGRGDGRRPGAGPRRDDRGPSRPQDGRGRPQGRDVRSGGGWRGQRQPSQEPRQPEPLPALGVSILPDERGVESLARQIRVTGRAYPLFQIAQLFLQKPERQQILLEVVKNPEGQPIQPLYHCALDESLWLSEDEAVSHVLRRHFGTFYQAERTPTDPPKGIYTFVAQCGMSGVILGPPNYHDYQNQLRKLHTERFSRVPFEAFKSRVKMVRDPEVVKRWVEEHSFKTEFLCLNVAETLKLPNRDEVEKHFRAVHMPNLIKQAQSYTISGAAARQLPSPALQRLLRVAADEQRRFPLKLATILSQKFAGHGLQFFKVNRTVTHVSVARPHYLDMEATPVSEGVRKIVQFIESTPKCTRRKLVETLAPSPKVETAPTAPPPVTEPAPVAEGAPAAPAEGTASAAQPAAPAEPQATPEQTALAADLHWLIHQGHVIEFANGVLETAKKPVPKPPKPEKPKAETPAAATSATEAPVIAEQPTETEGASVESASLEPAAVAAEQATANTESQAETLSEPLVETLEEVAGKAPPPAPGQSPVENSDISQAAEAKVLTD